MKKSLLLVAASLISSVAMADSYSLVFKDSGTENDGASVIKTDGTTTVESIVAEGTDYVAGFATIDAESTTRAYLGKAGYGLKFGNSSNPGNLSILLTAKGKVQADSIIVSAAVYGTETPHATLNGEALDITSAEFTDCIRRYNPAITLEKIDISGTDKGRCYIKSITVYYTAEESAFDIQRAHSPRYTAGKLYENVLGPDMIAYKTKTVDGAELSKPAIADRFAWIEYFNSSSTVDDGTAEVQTSNRWTNYDPSYDDYNYGEGGNWIQVKNAAGSANSPVLSFSNTNEDPAKHWNKYMTLYVKDVQRIEILGIGSAGGSAADGNNIQVVATAQDNSEVLEFASTPGAIYGKGTASDTCVVRLNPEKAYKVVIKNNQTVQKDIMIGNIRLYGVSEVAGRGVKVAEPTYAYWDVLTGPDMIVKGGNKVKTGEDGQPVDKWGINDRFTWIEYINPTSTLDDGTAEVQTSNRWTDINPRTGEKGEWIQVKGQDGDVNAPVLSAAWGKYMKFYVTGTNKFTAYGAGSASGSAADGNRLIIEAYPYNGGEMISAATEPGTIYGKGSASDFVSVTLDESESYEIVVRGDSLVKKDIQLLGINLGTSEGDANQLAGKGTLNIAIEKYMAEGGYILSLEKGETYTLNGIANVERSNFSLYGNNATIVTDETGQIVAKGKIFAQEVTIDASKSNVAPLAMANKDALTAADTAALYTFGTQYGTPAVCYTQEECDSYNAEHAEEITAGTLVALTTSTIKTPAEPGYKYPNATNAVFEGDGILILNSNIKVGSSVISGGNAPWAVNTVLFMNSVIEVTQKSGKAIINWEEGASQIKNITMYGCTFFADSTNTNMRFLRYTGQVDPYRVWGYDGTNENKNAPGQNTISISCCTFVNVCGDKDFANNIKNTAATTLSFKSNVFANTWRLQKLGSNLTYDFTNADNAIVGGLNAVDNTDLQKFATLDEVIGVVYNDTVKNFVPSQFSYAAKMKYGDPRWLQDVVYVDPTDSLKTLIAEATELLNAQDALTTLEEYSALQNEKTNADGIVAAESTAKVVVDEIATLATAIKAYQEAFTSGIATMEISQSKDNKTYDIYGRQINELSKGLYIKNGKKLLAK